jgi:hypothetical protein
MNIGRINFWTVIKDIEKIDVDEKSRKKIISLREQHVVLSKEIQQFIPKIEDNCVAVTRNEKEQFDRIWNEMSKIRKKIEKIIARKTKGMSKND